MQVKYRFTIEKVASIPGNLAADGDQVRVVFEVGSNSKTETKRMTSVKNRVATFQSSDAVIVIKPNLAYDKLIDKYKSKSVKFKIRNVLSNLVIAETWIDLASYIDTTRNLTFVMTELGNQNKRQASARI